MAGNDAKPAFGYKFDRGDENGTTSEYKQVGNITSVEPPALKKTMKDVTTHSSPGKTRQKRSTLVEWSSFRLKLNLQLKDPSQYHDYSGGLAADAATVGGERYYRIRTPDDDFTWYGPAEVEEFKPGPMTPEGIQEADVTVTPTGQWIAEEM